jgi:hypothetical protein
VKPSVRLAPRMRQLGGQLRRSPREGPEFGRKPSFHCERDLGFTAKQPFALVEVGVRTPTSAQALDRNLPLSRLRRPRMNSIRDVRYTDRSLRGC